MFCKNFVPRYDEQDRLCFDESGIFLHIGRLLVSTCWHLGRSAGICSQLGAPHEDDYTCSGQQHLNWVHVSYTPSPGEPFVPEYYSPEGDEA